MNNQIIVQDDKQGTVVFRLTHVRDDYTFIYEDASGLALFQIVSGKWCVLDVRHLASSYGDTPQAAYDALPYDRR